MRRLPEIDPGDPNLGSPWSFYRWLARRQAGQIASGAVLSAVAAGSFSSIPAWVGGAVQALTSGAPRPVFHGWIGLIALTGLVGVVAGLMEHRVGVAIRLTAGLRVQRLVVRHAGHLGVTLSRRLASGDAVALSGIESAHVGFSLTAVARAVGSLAAIGVVTAVLLSFSTVLGLLAVGGVVLVLAVIGVLLPPLERRLREVRDRVRDTADVAADAIAGLRVIRGIGAGSVVLERYRAVSRRLRTAATASAGRQSDLDAAQVLLPGLLVVSVSWVGARMALTGQITAGDLVAYYGYVMFLLLPFSSVIDAGGSVVRGLVAVRRIHGLLVVERDLDEPQDAPEVPLPAGPLVDHDYRLTIPPGASVGIVCDSTTEASSIGDRLARYVDADVTLGGVRLDRIARRHLREHIHLLPSDPVLFSGSVRDMLDPPRRGERVAVAEAVTSASADDVLESLPDGPDSMLAERGRSLSAGQRQRLALARALVTDPPVLILDEPTSAVDAHTEARISEGLVRTRRGHTTVVLTTSPLLLDRLDLVVHVAGGRVVAAGRHADLLRDCPAYRDRVFRGVRT